ncbi:formin-homology 2 domain-containing protein [Achlya hypogyna]|uniref:Formin-homology 2 domain-containing protein n=1 Tax=Achlya hypogyna TaxID=1202772 RepID=A0A1V9Z4M1_ACHHY|nr:formin-homology 2 domain-containing protein [Achlya hypogyna]
MTTVLYEVYEKQRRNVHGWSSELLAGEGTNFSEAVDGKGALGKAIVSLETARPPTGYRFVAEGWTIGEWSYGKSFKHIGVRTRGEAPLDTCRWRKHSRGLESLTTLEFGREPTCNGCEKSFNLMRRRHHCRGCHVAICKECSRKAVDRSNASMTRPQWFCLPCLASNPMLEAATSGARGTLLRRQSQAIPIPRLESMASIKSMKFCIECGYELPPHVKFCIDCGAGQNPTTRPSRESSAEELRGIFAAPPSEPSPVVAPQVLSVSPTASGAESVSESVDAPLPEPAPAEAEPESPEGAVPVADVLQAENQQLREMLEKLQRKLQRTEAKAVAQVEAQAQTIASLQQQLQEAATTPPAAALVPQAVSPATGVAVKEHPDYAKYFKLLSMGLPPEQVKMKMQQAGVDPALLDTPDAIVGGPPAPAAAGGVTVKDDERYAKFFKLLKMGMPAEQIKLKMGAEGLNPDLLETPDAVLADGKGTAAPAAAPAGPTADDPVVGKYLKLLKMGMPLEQVQLKMQASGVDPALLNGATTSAPVAHQVPTAGPPKLGDLQNMLARKASTKKPEEPPALPKKESKKPGTEMRSLFWTRIPVNVVKSTIWNSLSDDHVQLDAFDMELFFRKAPAAENKKDEDALKKKKESTNVLLLDAKTQQNVGIAIARYKLSPAEVKAALLALDTTVLTNDHVTSLITLAPTLEEQDILKNYDGPVEVLGAVEKFFLEMLTIPRYTQRIKCFKFYMQFEHRVLDIQAQIDTLTAATDQVADSTRLRMILETVLAIGNYMNGGTARGGAYGFKLEALGKLHTIRSIDPKVTLMNFLAKHLEATQPDVIAFAGEVPHIVEAKRMSLDQVKADITGCTSELAMLQGQVTASKSSTDPADKFYEIMAPFVKEAAEIVDEMSRDFQALESAFSELVASFGEDPRKFGAMEFFSVLDDFRTELKKAYRQNQSKEYGAIWDGAQKAKEDARLAQLEKERQEKISAEEAKTLYGQVLSTLMHACTERNVETAAAINMFKSHSRKYGNGEIDAEAFCDGILAAFGPQVALTVVPSCAKLLSDTAKRQALLAAYDTAHSGWESALPLFEASAPVAEPAVAAGLPRKRAPTLVIQDIQPVVGEEAQQLHRSILEAVHGVFNGDAAQVKVFTSKARKFGNQQLSAREFYAYLIATFEGDFVARLVPDLARLLEDAEKRHALLQALCESAPGWGRFAGRT